MTRGMQGTSGLIAMATVLCLSAPAWGQELSEWDAVRIALGESPSQQAATLDRRAADESLEAAEHERTPVFRAALGGGSDSSFGAEVFGVAPDVDGSVDLDLGLGWTSAVGTSLDVAVTGSWATRDATRDDTESNLDTFSSSYGAGASLRLTQPLLRGAGRDVGEARERSAQLAVTTAGYAFDATTSRLISDVLTAYWELWYAREALAVNRDALELAQRQLDEAQTQVDTLGTMARVDALRFASELATIEEELAQAESDIRTRSVELGRLLGMTPEDALDLQPVSTTPEHDEDMTVDEALELARSQSSDVLQAEADLESARDHVVVARDGTLPRLDLTASLSMGGLWNDSSAASGYQPNNDLGVTGMVGLTLELPLGNGQARAELSEARIRLDASELRLEATERQIEAETVTAVERLDTARRGVELAGRSEEISRELAQAEQESLRLGTTTTYQVLESQASLRRAELRRLRALVDQTKAAVSLQHLTGQLLLDYAELTGTL